jgi:hypothetical protein
MHSFNIFDLELQRKKKLTTPSARNFPNPGTSANQATRKSALSTFAPYVAQKPSTVEES